MREKIIIIILALALAAAGASAKLGDLVASFQNFGSSYHFGLAADSTHLYTMYYYAAWKYPIIRMLRENGRFISSYSCPLTLYPDSCRGLSYGGGSYLYISNYYIHMVGRFYGHNGSLISSWTWPTGNRFGICCTHDGTNPGSYIYQNYYDAFYYSTTTGSFISSFSISFRPSNYDLAWDYGNNMIWFGHLTDNRVYGITTTGSIVASWPLPGTATYPRSLAYYDKKLYVANDSGTPRYWIWVFDCPSNVGLKPASVGRVKALFE